jgi:hypothetical protein
MRRLGFRTGLMVLVLLGLWADHSRGQEIFPLEHIRPGMRGVSLTVLQGTKVEAIETEILGVQRGALGSGRDMIIGRLVDPRTATSGAVHGMSGSPLMIEGKLAGALSRRLMIFEKDGHCGFTPAADMFDVERRKPGTGPTSGPWQGGQWVSRDQWKAWGLHPRAETSTGMLGIPVALPSWDEATAHLFAPLLRDLPGLVPVAGRASSGGVASALPLEPGNALAVVLMDGDISIAGTGTLTWTDGKRFMGFGHPMLGIGETNLPVAPAEIITIVPSYLMPFKLSNPGPVRGAMIQDRLSAISGTFNAEAPTGRYHLRRTHQGEKRPDLTGRFAQNELVTPFLIAMALRSVLIDEQDFSWDTTLRIRGQVGLRGLPPMQIDGIYSGDFGARMQALFDQIFPLLQLARAFPKQVVIESLEARVDTHESASVWELFEVLPQTRAARPGEGIAVRIGVRNLQGQERWVEGRVDVPEEVRSGTINLRAASGDLLSREAMMDSWFGTASGPEAVLRARKAFAFDRIHLQLTTQAPGRAHEGWRQPALPGSVARNAPGRNFRHTFAETSLPMNGVVRGYAETSLKVELP